MNSRLLAILLGATALALVVIGTVYLASVSPWAEGRTWSPVLFIAVFLVVYGVLPAAALSRCFRRPDPSEIALWICASAFGGLCLVTSLGLGPGIIYFPAALMLVLSAIARSFANANAQHLSPRT